MTGTAVKGTFAVGFEPTSSPGRQTILSAQACAATLSATNQPLGSTGVHCHIWLTGIGLGSAGSITITGKAIDGVTAVTETWSNITTALVNNEGYAEYGTTNVFGSINSSGITMTGVSSGALSSATVTVFGIVAAKWLIPATMTIDEFYDVFSPPDLRGILDEDIRMQQLIKHVTFDISSALYPESTQFLGLACIANATTPATPASNPSSQTSILAATALSGAPFTSFVANTPKAPGQLLQLVIAGGNAATGTLTITGTGPLGNTVSEVLTLPATNGTYYSANVYATITSIAKTGLTGSATLAVNGAYAYNPIFLPTDGQLVSLSGEWYDGTASNVLPWLLPSDFTIEYDVNKELKFNMKGDAQDMVAIGDTTVSSMTTSAFSTYTQPIDAPIVGWPGLFYIDPIGGTAGATQSLDIITFKIMGQTGLKPYWTATGQQQFNRAGRKKRKTTFEAEVDFINMKQYNLYKGFNKQFFVAKFNAPGYIGPGIQKYIQFQLNARQVKFQRIPKDTDEKVIGKISGTCEYEPSTGYAFNMSMLNQNNPTYAS